MFAPNWTAVIGAMLAAFTTRPVYMNRGVKWMGLASCKAFFTATVGCVQHTSMMPLRPPMPVCSQKLNFLPFADMVTPSTVGGDRSPAATRCCLLSPRAEMAIFL